MSLDIRLPILLRRLRLPTVAANYRKFAQEAAHSSQPYEEYLLALLEHEANQRDVNRRKRRVYEAHFPLLRTLDEFDFAALPSLNRNKVLDLSKSEYIDRHENVALIGSIGTGKTHIAISLGLTACEQGRRVRFYTAAGLINELLEAQDAHRLSKLEAWLMRQDLVVLDEVDVGLGDGHAAEQVLPQVGLEGVGVAARQVEVLVQVDGLHPCPVNAGLLAERGQERVLGGGGGEVGQHGPALVGRYPAQQVAHVAGSGPAHRLFGGVDLALNRDLLESLLRHASPPGRRGASIAGPARPVKALQSRASARAG